MEPSAYLPLREPTLYILLSLSADNKHGYAILQDVEALSDGRVQLSTSTLYEALARLLDQGLIARVEGPAAADDQNPGRPRKVYRLTPSGRRVLNAEVARLQGLVTTALQRLRTAGSR